MGSSALSNPARVPSLAVRWTFNVPAADTVAGADPGFRASPVEDDGRVFIGSGNGRVYALNAETGTVLWKFPAPPAAPLRSQFTCNPSSQGIASSAAVAEIGGKDAVIFGAPDPSIGTGLGEGRLFALNAKTGAVIWKSPVIARVTGTTSGSTTEFHQQIGYSSPVVHGDRIYIGVGDHCDNPIQKGRVVSVRLNDGAIDPAFTYCSTGTCADATRGGGVWSGVAAWGEGVYATTGNTASAGPEPSPNHGLSMLAEPGDRCRAVNSSRCRSRSTGIPTGRRSERDVHELRTARGLDDEGRVDACDRRERRLAQVDVPRGDHSLYARRRHDPR